MKAMSHLSTGVDVPKILQLPFIFKPVVIYSEVCFLAAGSSLTSSSLLPPDPSPGGLDERECGTLRSHKVPDTVVRLHRCY